MRKNDDDNDVDKPSLILLLTIVILVINYNVTHNPLKCMCVFIINVTMNEQTKIIDNPGI